MVNLLNTFIIGDTAILQQRSLMILEENLQIFYTLRSSDWLLIGLYLVSNILVPVLVSQTLTNPSPFWGSIFAYFIINERISKLKRSAILISFSALAVISMAQINLLTSNIHKSDYEPKSIITFENENTEKLASLMGCLCVMFK